MKNSFPLPEKVSKEEIELCQKFESFYLKTQDLYKDWIEFSEYLISKLQVRQNPDLTLDSSDDYELSVQMDSSNNKLISCQILNSKKHEQKN